MRAALGFVPLVMFFTLVGSAPGSAANEAQVRAKCTQAAEKNGISAQRRQLYIDTCVTKVMASQKK